MDNIIPNRSMEDGEAENFFPSFLMADSQISNLDISPPEPEQPNELAWVPPRSTAVTHKRHFKNGYSSDPPNRDYAYSETPRDQPWEADAVSIERRQLPAHPDESQQDLAERLNHITHTLDNYVVRPCRKVPGMLRTYYPGVRDGLRDGLEALTLYEGQLRRAVANHVNGREMARLQGVGDVSGKEEERLKDRLVEKDALLWDSNQHVRRLMRERDALKKQLETMTTTTRRHIHSTEGDLLCLDISEDGGSQPEDTPDVHHADGDNKSATREKEVTVPVDQLRDLRVLIDQMSIREGSKQEIWKSKSNEDSQGNASDGHDEEPEWTML